MINTSSTSELYERRFSLHVCILCEDRPSKETSEIHIDLSLATLDECGQQPLYEYSNCPSKGWENKGG